MATDGQSKPGAGTAGLVLPFYGLQEKEKSLGSTLPLSLACWWDSSKTGPQHRLAEQGWGMNSAPGPWSSLARREAAPPQMTEQTSQEPEHGWMGGTPHFRSIPWQTKAPCSSGPVQGGLRGASPQTRTGDLRIVVSKVTQLTPGITSCCLLPLEPK